MRGQERLVLPAHAHRDLLLKQAPSPNFCLWRCHPLTKLSVHKSTGQSPHDLQHQPGTKPSTHGSLGTVGVQWLSLFHSGLLCAASCEGFLVIQLPCMFPPTFPHVFCSLKTGLLASMAFVLDIFPCGPISYSAYFLVCPLGGLKVASNIITLQSLGSVM